MKTLILSATFSQVVTYLLASLVTLNIFWPMTYPSVDPVGRGLLLLIYLTTSGILMVIFFAIFGDDK